MVNWRKKYYAISGADSSCKSVFEVRNNPQKPWGKPSTKNPTKYGSLYMDCISEHFDMDTIKNLARDKSWAINILHYAGPERKGEFGRLLI